MPLLSRSGRKADFGPAESFDPDDKLNDAAGHEDHSDGTSPTPLASNQSDIPACLVDMSDEERRAAESRLVRKIDIRLLPLLVLMYILNYLDRSNIAAARLQGLERDLDLTSTQYETCVSILFVGYILMQIPSNLFLNKVGKPAVYLPAVMVVWGVISACTAATESFGGLLACRFLLGFVEAAYFPGCLFFLSSWYTRKELAFRTALLYSGSLISGAFSGLIAAGILNGLNGARGIAAWRWLFIIEGAITVTVAICAFFVLPNFPRTTTWLTERERALAIYRLQLDVGLDDWVSSEHQTFFDGFKLAFKDVKTYLLAIVLLGFVSSASVTNFFPTVVKTLKFNDTNTLLLTAPPYVLAVITAFCNARHADRTGERYLHITLPLLVSIAAFILAAAATSTAARYVAMMLMPASFYAGYVVGLAWISNSLPRPPAKRAAALAAINAISNTANIYASYMYKTSFAPQYVIAMSVNCGTAVMAIAAATVLRMTLARLNARLDRGESVEGAVSGNASADTVAEKKGFRFLL